MEFQKNTNHLHKINKTILKQKSLTTYVRPKQII